MNILKSIIFSILISFLSLNSAEITKKKILYIDSYDKSFFWSQGIKKGLLLELKKSSMQIDFLAVEMDTLRNQSEAFKKQSALKMKKIIEEFRPDIVIASDDNASKYLIVPYFYNSDIPFIFCGVNGSAKIYGFPSKNVTGMLEVIFIKEMLGIIKKYKKIQKIAYLGTTRLTSIKEARTIESRYNIKLEKRFVNTSIEWKKKYKELQKEVDLILIGIGPTSLFNKEEQKKLKSFIYKNTEIPSVSWHSARSEFALLTFSIKAEEQGSWSMKTALEVLKGRDISTIKVVKNKNANIFINTILMKKFNIKFPFSLFGNASLVE